MIPSGPYDDPDKKHLFVICNDADDDGNHIIVPISSWVNDLCDATCRLQSHEHDFLTHDSYVLYRKANITAADGLLINVQNGLFAVHDPMNGQTFLKIRNGLCRSIHTPRRVKRSFGCADERAEGEV